MFRVWHALLSVHCSLVVTCWEMAYLLALLYVMGFCVIVTFPFGVLGQVWCLIVSIPDLCLLTYFIINEQRKFLFVLKVQTRLRGWLVYMSRFVYSIK